MRGNIGQERVSRPLYLLGRGQTRAFLWPHIIEESSYSFLPSWCTCEFKRCVMTISMFLLEDAMQHPLGGQIFPEMNHCDWKNIWINMIGGRKLYQGREDWKSVPRTNDDMKAPQSPCILSLLLLSHTSLKPTRWEDWINWVSVSQARAIKELP